MGDFWVVRPNSILAEPMIEYGTYVFSDGKMMEWYANDSLHGAANRFDHPGRTEFRAVYDVFSDIQATLKALAREAEN